MATIGYGDLYPISNLEKLVDMVVMVGGVAFFSYIMGSFISIIQKFDDLLDEKDESNDLHNWLALVRRFNDNKPLSEDLIKAIDNHFAHYWKNDRLDAVSTNNEFLKALPRNIKRSVMLQYIFDDVLHKFRIFFNTTKNIDSKFLYDISFGLKPRQFLPDDSTSMIYDEEDEVSEMYLIDSGIVGIGFYLMSQDDKKRSFLLGISVKEGYPIGDYYVLSNKRSQFLFVA